MKPRRLDPLELTDEDREVNYVFCVARGLSEFRGAVLCLSEDADRRDADLMLEIAVSRLLTIKYDGGFYVKEFSRDRIVEVWSS